jgi:Xaa-Pro aminopeptidase
MSRFTELLAKLRELMQAAKLDCAVVGPTTAMRHLLGFAPHADERLCLLVVDAERAQLVAPEINAGALGAVSDLEMLLWTDEGGPGEALERSFLRGARIRTLGVDGAMRADFLLPLLELLGPQRMVPLDPVAAPLRMIKTDREVAALAASARLADLAMEAAVEACRPGVSEADVAWAAEECFRRSGAEKVEFTLVAAGANAASPHHASGGKKLEEGEGVIIDIGGSLGGYKSDITRVVHLGEPDDEFLRVFETVRSANEAGVAAVRPGVTAEQVDQAARKVIEEAGYGQWFIHRTGHGIGLDIHEPPWIMDGQHTVLTPGMAFSVEPGIYLKGRLGVRVEDIVVVESSSARNLTGFDRRLVVK